MHHLPSRYIPCDGRLTASAYFKSTLPAWGATRLVSQQHCCCAFQSTLPAGERQSSSLLCVVLHYISTHTPRIGSNTWVIPWIQRRLYFNQRSPHGERRCLWAITAQACNFNPRSPHGERLWLLRTNLLSGGFQSTLPAWGATIS